MVAGSVAFFAYSLVIAWSLLRRRLPAVPTTSAAWVVWLLIAFGLWGVFLR
jgi:hypothetical protein